MLIRESKPTPNDVDTVAGASAAASGAGFHADYLKHYTESGDNALASFTMDVSFHDAVGVAAGTGTRLDQWTVTYSGSLTVLGQNALTVAPTTVALPALSTPFWAATTPGAWTATLNPTFADAAANGALSRLNLGLSTWDHLHADLTVTQSASGPALAADGPISFFASSSTEHTWYDRTRTWAAAVAADGPGAARVVTDTDHYGGDYRYDATTSNLAANLPSAAAALGADGRPTDLFADAAGGTTFLTRSFDAGSYTGLATLATTRGADDGFLHATSTGHLDFSGVDGARDYLKVVTVTPAAADPLSSVDSGPPLSGSGFGGAAAGLPPDVTTARVNYQRVGTYGGHREYDRSSSNNDAYAGTATVERHDGGQVLADSASLRAQTHRRTAGGSADDDRTVSRDIGATPGTYSDHVTEHLTYGADGPLTADTLDYGRVTGGDVHSTLSDRLTSRAWVYPPAGGAALGTLTRTAYVFQGDTRHADQTVAGTRDLLHGGGTINDSLSYSGTSSGRSDGGARLTPLGGGPAVDTETTHAERTGATSGGATAHGAVNAAGRQTSGTSTRHAEGVADDSGTDHAVDNGPGAPAKTTDVADRGGSITGSSGDLTYHSDGTADGTQTAFADTWAREESTATAGGYYFIPGATCSADDRDHRLTRQASYLNVDLTLTADKPTGTVTSQASTRVNYDHRAHRTLVTNDGASDVTLDAGDAAHDPGSSGTGWTALRETVDGALCGGNLTATRTVDFKQRDDGGTSLSDHGWLADSQGHSGTWKLDVKAAGTMGDALAPDHLVTTSTLGANGWVETGRTIHVNDHDERTAHYHEDDNGLKTPARPASIGGDGPAHLRDDYRTQSDTTIEDGTPEQYAFTKDRCLSTSGEETWLDDWKAPARGEGGRLYRHVESDHGLRDDRSGTATAGQEMATHVGYDKVDGAQAVVVWSFYAAGKYTENHRVDEDGREERREGDPRPVGQGTGFLRVTADHRRWWKLTDRATGRLLDRGGDSTPPAAVPDVDLSWPASVNRPDLTLTDALWQDFAASAAGAWVIRHWGDALRLVGGAVDVGFGIGLSLGSGGLAILPGAGLMAVGIDQLYTGVANMVTGRQDPSVIELGVSTAMRDAGATEQSAQVAGALAPAALSLFFTFTGGLLGGAAEGTLNSAGEELGTSPRPLPSDVESRITKLYEGDALPPSLRKLPEFGATSLLTGEIFVNGAVWDTLADGVKARIFFEELSHQGRILATPRFLRPLRSVLMGVSDTYRFIEETRAAWDATLSFREGLSYAWRYPDISRLQIGFEVGTGVGVSAYITWRALHDR